MTATVAALLALSAPSAAAVADPQGPPGNPDNRRYEMVSPLEKNGADILGFESNTQTALDGERVSFSSLGAFASAQHAAGSLQYLAERTSTGWMTSFPGPVHTRGQTTVPPVFQGFSPDLSQGVLRTSDVLTDGADSTDTAKLYLRSFASPEWSLLTPAGMSNEGMNGLNPTAHLLVAGATPDFEHILLETWVPQTPDAPISANTLGRYLYDWHAGGLDFVGYLPDGSRALEGALAGGSLWGGGAIDEGDPNRLIGANVPFDAASWTKNVISDDGSRIFWTDYGDETTGSLAFGSGDVFVRIDHQQTLELSGSRRTDCAADPTCGGDGVPDPQPDPSGEWPSLFLDATPDGSKAWFTTREQLTDDADGTPGFDGYLYEFDVDANDVRVVAPMGGDVGTETPTGIAGFSDDGEYLYFTSPNELTPDADPSPDVTNLYIEHDGDLRFVAALFLSRVDTDEAFNYSPFEEVLGQPRQSRVTSDGRYLLFSSKRQLTSYDNAGRQMLYRFDESVAGPNALECITCNPSGAPPASDATTTSMEPPGIGRGVTSRSFRRIVMNDDASRIYFDTKDALVPEDVNGRVDAYEWHEGDLRLISTGRSSDDSYFAGTSTDGQDVFFATRERLVGWDTDDLVDMYDARIGGGFPEPVRPPAACSAESCQTPPSAPPAAADPASSLLSGAGDVAPGLRAAFSARALAGPARAGRVALRIRVSRPGRVSAVGRARIGKRRVVVARGSKRVAKAGAVTLSLSLSRSARRRLAVGASLPLSVAVRFSGAAEPRQLSLRLGKGR